MNKREEAYETLYCSSIAFGMRKFLLSQEEKDQIQERILQLKEKKKLNEAIVSDLKVKADQAEQQNQELESEKVKHAEEIASIKKANSQLKAQLDGIVASKN